MNNKLRALLGSMLLIGAAAATNTFAQGENSGGGRLSGAWDADVAVFNCDTGAPIADFQSTAIFNQGGTFTGITSGIPPAARTPEVGVWRHVNKDTYVFKFKAYLFNNGVATNYQILTHQIELGGDNLTYTSAGGVQVFTMDGVQVGSACSTSTGSRFAL